MTLPGLGGKLQSSASKQCDISGRMSSSVNSAASWKELGSCWADTSFDPAAAANDMHAVAFITLRTLAPACPVLNAGL